MTFIAHLALLVTLASGASTQATEITLDTCEAGGGILLSGYGGPICAQPEADAGAECTDSSQCSGLCLADTMTCSLHYPMIGCFKYIDSGETREICID